ncbi:UDP-N-acetylmuramoyl-L-alanyl-D-glutamate--2,6-diaminopimelate ligase [Kocuria sp. JC486]|uniref:UDP-N-acetylmuramoyl-L-alanyl-D-glutamate--2, 6-diaminopimelate ligase n=1 Tax=Kocuria sp. JC486 TaxID=1970736 RepID=UPI0014241CF2|nr:UDP-N-acetylmuramoyl-L-alanyl-D-glutamate--2,6-diaminopimelate ligase [Kocuria sp. JC486]NHU84415.1 UDP-N-acetylmuramoyl-L-alanyl-D-glutamate--2,6-diaminopimelate ligase [Kocuria sp. JC486]
MENSPEITTDAALLRPEGVSSLALGQLASLTGGQLLPGLQGTGDAAELRVSGVSIDSRAIRPGDLYAALPGARFHGADFADGARKSGAVAVLTDPDGARILGEQAALPVIVVEDPRAQLGAVARTVYGSQPQDGTGLGLFGVTGTNGKTTTTYFVNSILRALGETTGLIGTIEILADDQKIPSKLTTPEASTVHALLAVMRESGMTAASMEVSSHAIEFDRVAGVRYDVAGFTNLTQDHLDLHGTMQAYFDVKARLFTPERTGRAVVVVADDDDEWGIAMARHARAQLGADNVDVFAMRGGVVADREGGPQRRGADWTLHSMTRRGIGHAFELVHRDGRSLRVSTGLPGEFNVANAALATLMVLASGVDLDLLQRVLDEHDPLTTDVPGRMQLIGTEPTAVVDFAHNPDALARALAAVDPPEGNGRVILVFGATGDRDKTKRPLMGEIAAREADVVIISDDDPHGEDPAAIRAEVAAGAHALIESGRARAAEVHEISPRAVAIRSAVRMAGRGDSVIVAGRGHETVQEIAGVDHPLDDRAELRAALEDMQEGRWEHQ